MCDYCRSLLPAQVASWPSELYQANAVVAALHAIFAALEAEEGRKAAAKAGQAGGNGSPPSGSPANGIPANGTAEQQQAQQQRSVVNPTPLREALGALPGKEFGVGEHAHVYCAALRMVPLGARSYALLGWAEDGCIIAAAA